MFKRFTYLLLLLGALLVSCAKPVDQAEYNNINDGSEPGDEKPLYALITKEESNAYMQKMEEGFRQACEEIGADYICYGPSGYSAEAQVEFIESLIDQGVDAIAIAVNDADVLDAPLKDAMDKGILVISLDSAANAGSRALHIQQADPERVGRVLMQAAASMIEYDGTVGVITTTGYATNQNLWVEWIKQEAADYPEKYKNIILLPEVYGNDDETETIRQTLYLLEEYPELDIIITPSVVSMVAVGNTLREQGSEVLFTGLGLPSEMADFIKIDKSCPWFYLWNPIELGYIAAQTANALFMGDINGDIGDVFTAGSLGQRMVTHSVDGGKEVLLGEPLKFDEENITLWKTVY